MMLVPNRDFDLFDDIFGDPFFRKSESKMMKTDIREDKDNYVIDIDLPGFDKKNIKIDITDDGFVSVCGVEQAGMDKAMKYIKTIVEDFEEGKIYEGKVVSIKEFGAFVEFAPGKEGMVHISKISNERINHVEDVLTLGDHVKCKCMGKDKMGRISFSIKDAM